MTRRVRVVDVFRAERRFVGGDETLLGHSGGDERGDETLALDDAHAGVVAENLKRAAAAGARARGRDARAREKRVGGVSVRPVK